MEVDPGGAHGAHEPVLLEAALDALVRSPHGIYCDATFGRGGHSRAILRRLSPRGRLVAIDRDPQAIAVARAVDDARFTAVHARFSQLPIVLDELGVRSLDGLLADLGVSSPQLDQVERGFSFQHDAPLDLRMDQTNGEPAWRWLEAADEAAIREVLENYGEERSARSIAKAIVARRTDAAGGAIRTTRQLADLVARIVRRRARGKALAKNPATRTFQALRILVNQELEELTLLLSAGAERLAPGARLAIICFHSLESRIVKEFFANESGRNAARDPVTGQPMPTHEPRLRVVTRVLPDDAEQAANPRARSASLRVAERLPASPAT